MCAAVGWDGACVATECCFAEDQSVCMTGTEAAGRSWVQLVVLCCCVLTSDGIIVICWALSSNAV